MPSMLKNVGEKMLDLSLYLSLHLKLMWALLGLVLTPSFMEIHFVVFVQSCWLTNQPTDRPTDSKEI